MTELKADPGCCEEASVASHETYIPCNRLARYMVEFPRRDEGPYRMCESCTEYNVSNRSALIIGGTRSATETFSRPSLRLT